MSYRGFGRVLIAVGSLIVLMIFGASTADYVGWGPGNLQIRILPWIYLLGFFVWIPSAIGWLFTPNEDDTEE